MSCKLSSFHYGNVNTHIGSQQTAISLRKLPWPPDNGAVKICTTPAFCRFCRRALFRVPCSRSHSILFQQHCVLKFSDSFADTSPVPPAATGKHLCFAPAVVHLEHSWSSASWSMEACLAPKEQSWQCGWTRRVRVIDDQLKSELETGGSRLKYRKYGAIPCGHSDMMASTGEHASYAPSISSDSSSSSAAAAHQVHDSSAAWPWPECMEEELVNDVDDDPDKLESFAELSPPLALTHGASKTALDFRKEHWHNHTSSSGKSSTLGDHSHLVTCVTYHPHLARVH